MENNDCWPDHWPEWVVESFYKLALTENGAERLLPDNAPEWAFEILAEIIKLSFPKLNLRTLDQSGPEALGAFCGHQQWLEESEYGFKSKFEQLEQALLNLNDLLLQKTGKKKYAKLVAAGERYNADIEYFLDSIDLTLSEKKNLIRSIVTLAGEQTLSEKSDFMTAYAKALKCPTFDESGTPIREKFPGTSKIYILIVLFWRHVNDLPTMKALHDWLCRLLGKSAIGPYDNGRVKGICKRFGIHLAPRGRPRKKRH